MALVTNITRRVDIPHEDGEWVEIRRLSGKQKEDAAITRQINAARVTREWGGDVLAATQKFREDTDDDGEDAIERASSDPLTTYDKWTVLRHSIKTWSYSDKVNTREIESLDEVTVDWLARVVILFSDHPDIVVNEAPIEKALYSGERFQESVDEAMNIVDITGNAATPYSDID